MPSYEYKVLPAPRKGEKAKGIRTPEGRFANALENLMNRMGEAGWEFLRAELLPNDERAGLTGQNTEWRNVLVFRRPREDSLDAFEPRLIEGPERPEPELTGKPRRSPLGAVAAGLTGGFLGRAKRPEPEPEPDFATATAPVEASQEQLVAEAAAATLGGALVPGPDEAGAQMENPDEPQDEAAVGTGLHEAGGPWDTEDDEDAEDGPTEDTDSVTPPDVDTPDEETSDTRQAELPKEPQEEPRGTS